MENGQSKEGDPGGDQQDSRPWRQPIPLDGTCVRIGAMRCHAQALTVKPKKDVPLDEIQSYREPTRGKSFPTRKKPPSVISPPAVTGTLTVPSGGCANSIWAVNT